MDLVHQLVLIFVLMIFDKSMAGEQVKQLNLVETFALYKCGNMREKYVAICLSFWFQEKQTHLCKTHVKRTTLSVTMSK